MLIGLIRFIGRAYGFKGFVEFEASARMRRGLLFIGFA